MSSRDSLHSEATDCVNPELPPSPTGFTRELPPDPLPLGAVPRDSHFPDYHRDPSSDWFDLREAHIRNYVAAMVPALRNLLDQPPPHVFVREARDGHWACPACGYAIWPYGLGPDEQALLDIWGVWDNMVVQDEETSDFHLDTSNPWRFLRYLDALAWAHMDEHLRRIGMLLTYPKPWDCRPVSVPTPHLRARALTAKIQSSNPCAGGSNRNSRRQRAVPRMALSSRRSCTRFATCCDS